MTKTTESQTPEAMWAKFIEHLNTSQPLPGNGEHKCFLGSIEQYRKLFLEANKT